MLQEGIYPKTQSWCSSVDIKLALPTVLIHLPIRQFLRGISFFFLYGLRMELKHTYHFLQVKLNRKVGSSLSKKVSSKFQIQRIWSMPISLLWLGKREDKQNRKIWRRELYLLSFTYLFLLLCFSLYFFPKMAQRLVWNPSFQQW